MCRLLSHSLLVLTALAAMPGRAEPIDRRALVTRHDVTLTAHDPLSPLTVGNGEFAVTVDVTGLQSFPEAHGSGIPLGTQSQWGWNTSPNPEGYRLEDVLRIRKLGGRVEGYPDQHAFRPPLAAAAQWLRANPHRIDLGRVGLVLRRADGTRGRLSDLGEVRQTLHLWEGRIESRFTFEQQPVRAVTRCHPSRDVLGVDVESPLLREGRLALELSFPAPSEEWGRAKDGTGTDDCHTTLMSTNGRHAEVVRQLSGTAYHVRVEWSAGALTRQGPHTFRLDSGGATALSVAAGFAPGVPGPLPTPAELAADTTAHWAAFWSGGGVVDFSGSTDPRARELERRVVLSQYLTAVQCAGSLPPQETGLTLNSWHGKFHLEMHWWHAAHFPIWQRASLLERSLSWYDRILPAAQATARSHGCRGARWPKMTDPAGRESPSPVGPFLIWQQPHPIYYAELMHRAAPGRATLEKYRDVVFETAEFMATWPRWDEGGQRFNLGPPLIPAQECYSRSRDQVINPTFELAYWHWALDIAQQWRERLGLPRDPEWDKVLQQLARPLVRDGVYAAMETEPFTRPVDHPSMLAALGVVPSTPLIDPAIMGRTLEAVRRTWNWGGTWGWDFPMGAMTAARVGRPDEAVAWLMMETPKNRYLPNGHNYQTPDLPLYLPGNGGLLTAVALMAAGWDGNTNGPAPGFPRDGTWRVRYENLSPLP